MRDDDTRTYQERRSTGDGTLDTAGGTAAAGSAWTRRLVVAALIAASVNLRPAVTSLGPLMQEVRDDLGMSGTVAGALTSVPMLCFALFGAAAPRLARRFGPGAIVCAGVVVLTAGLLLRPFSGDTAAFLGASVLAMAGIGVGNVLMPVIVKRYFPDRVGTMTGLYSMGISVGTAIAAAATVPMDHAMGDSWRLGLGTWALVAGLAVPFWLPLVRDRAGAAGLGSAAPAAPVPGQQPAEIRITRSRTAWALAIFFGLQATAAYITMGWLPQIFRDAGVSASEAGLLLAITMSVSVPLSFVLPALAGRMRNQGPLALTLAAFGLAGYAGLLTAASAAPLLWAILLGMANCSFPLALTMIGMRARTGPGVTKLSAFVQCTGYLLSIPGPILVGTLYQHTGGWTAPIALVALLLVPQSVAGLLAGRDRQVEDELAG